MNVGHVKLQRRVFGVSHGGVILPPGTRAPVASGEPEKRVSASRVLRIPLTLGATIKQTFAFAHPGQNPRISLIVLGLYVNGRVKEAKRLHEELETGPAKGQGKAGLEEELLKQRHIEIFLSLEWAAGFVNAPARNDAVLFQTIEHGEETGDYEAYEEVGPGSWGIGRWVGKETALDHQTLSMASFRKGGEADLDEARLELGVTESWDEAATGGGGRTAGTILAGPASVGHVPS